MRCAVSGVLRPEAVMQSSRPLYICLQRPDTAQWVTIVRYLLDERSGTGRFRYAPSYQDAGLSWTIDPVNLPLVPGIDHIASRYRGLHDVLRDACPDAWGKLLIQREHGLLSMPMNPGISPWQETPAAGAPWRSAPAQSPRWLTLPVRDCRNWKPCPGNCLRFLNGARRSMENCAGG
jgi:hypothetical protein